jgi:hypothetical protein
MTSEWRYKAGCSARPYLLFVLFGKAKIYFLRRIFCFIFNFVNLLPSVLPALKPTAFLRVIAQFNALLL